MRTKQLTAIIVGTALVTAACSPASSGVDQSTTAPTVVAAPSSTTSTASTTSTVPPTTTTTPLASVRISGEMPDEVASAVANFLSAVQDPRNDTGSLNDELISHHTSASGSLAHEYSGTAAIQELETGGAVGVITLTDGDLVLVADEGTGWSVVGAHLTSLETDPWFGESPRRVLVLGSDARPGFDAATHRMDSIHILTAVPAEGSGAILGYPRDWWIDTPYGETRINALTSYGRGPEALYSQYTEEWEIPLDGYILTAFSGFEKLIAAAVGRLVIELPIPIPVQEWWPGFASGPQTLTPTRTLDYARTRKRVPGGDFARSKHQGVIMLAVLTMLQQGSVQDVPMLIGELARHTVTNLTPTDLIQLGVAAYYMDVGEITNEVLPGHLGRAGNGASVVFLEPEADAIIADVIDDGVRNDS